MSLVPRLCLLCLWSCVTGAEMYFDEGKFQVEISGLQSLEILESHAGIKVDGERVLWDEEMPDLEELMGDIYDEVQYRMELKKPLLRYLLSHYPLGRATHVSTLQLKLFQILDSLLMLYTKVDGEALQQSWVESQERLADLVVIYAYMHDIPLGPTGPRNIKIVHWRFTVTVPVLKYSLDDQLSEEDMDISKSDMTLLKNIMLPA